MIRRRQIAIFGLLIGFITLCALPILLLAGDDCRAVNFELGPQDPEIFSDAVFRVDDGGDIGTAFLIDSMNGYLLTAKHVVKRTIADKSIAIVASTPALPGAKLSVKIERVTSDKQDLALLKISEVSKVSNITPLDIGLRPPVRGSKLSAMGYPTTYGDEINTKLRVQLEVKVMSSPTEDGLIEVSQVAIGGSSGGPLVDSSGLAVGICLEEVGIGDAVARYAPMSDAEPLLNLLPQHAVVQSLDAQVVEHTVKPQDLVSAFKRGPGHASNVDLYTWARHILGRRADYKASSEYFSCPIIRAMMHRRLDDAVFWLGGLASPDDFAFASLTVAERKFSDNHPRDALNIISPVIAELAKAPDTTLQFRSLLVQASSMTSLGQGEDALNLLTSKAASLPPGSALKAGISGEIARLYAIQNGVYQNGADDPMTWFDDAIERYTTAELETKKLGSSGKLGEIYQEEAYLLQKKHYFSESLDKLTSAREVYRQIGDFRGESEVLYKMAVTADRFDPARASRFSKEYLALDPGGSGAEAATAILLKAGAKPQDLPGLHHSGTDWVVTATQDVPHGDYVYVPNPPCAQDMAHLVQTLNNRLQEFAGPAISQFAGPLASVSKGNSGSAVERLLHIQGNEPRAQCTLICAVYPNDAIVEKLELWAGEQNRAVSRCSLDKNSEFPCEIGWSKWLKPVVQNGRSGIACGIFMNWSHDRNRTASMTVAFKPGHGWNAKKIAQISQ